jgi:hypothetical protein
MIGPFTVGAACFDLIDANGRDFPLLVEARYHSVCPGDHGGHGVIIDRDTTLELATFSATGNIQFNDNAAKYFATYQPMSAAVEPRDWKNRRFNTESHIKDDQIVQWTNTRSNGSSDASDPLAVRATVVRAASEILTRCHLAANLTRSDYWPLCGNTVTMFQSLHPKRVVLQFGRAVMEMSGFNSSILPTPIVDIIINYSPIDLPFLPLSPAESDDINDNIDAKDELDVVLGDLHARAAIEEAEKVKDEHGEKTKTTPTADSEDNDDDTYACDNLGDQSVFDVIEDEIF